MTESLTRLDKHVVSIRPTQDDNMLNERRHLRTNHGLTEDSNSIGYTRNFKSRSLESRPNPSTEIVNIGKFYACSFKRFSIATMP